MNESGPMRIKTMWKRSVCFLGCLIKKAGGVPKPPPPPPPPPPSKKRKDYSQQSTRRRDSSKAIRRPVMPARFISLGWRVKDSLAARLG